MSSAYSGAQRTAPAHQGRQSDSPAPGLQGIRQSVGSPDINGSNGNENGYDAYDAQQSPMRLEFDTFQQASFGVAAIVESLTSGLIDSSKSGGAFNPAPFIEALDVAVDELIPLRKSITQRTTSTEKRLQDAERQYSAKVQDLKQQFNTVTTGFTTLEQRITEVSRATVRVGDELESLDRLRTRASDARDIISYYHDFAKGDTTAIEGLRKSGRDGRAKVAVLLRRLSSVAKEVEDVPGGEQTRDAIDKYCERFENSMLKLFDQYYRKGDPKSMAHCAKVLLDFNGGQSCIQIYVNQHEFFISQSRIQDPGAVTNTPLWDALPDPNALAPRTEPGLSKLYKELRFHVNQEGNIITAVFPNPAIVMQVFLQRVFAQVIQNYIEQLIETASSTTTLAFLRIVFLARASTHTLIEDLKAQTFFKNLGGAATGSLQSTDKAPISILSGSLPTSASNTAGPVLILDAALGELFLPYTDKYIEREQKSLTEIYAAYLAKFTRWHQLHSKATKANTGANVFDRMVDRIAAATKESNVTDKASSAASAIGQEGARGFKQLLKLGGINEEPRRSSADAGNVGIGSLGASQRVGAGPSGLVVTDADGQISLDIAERMLTWHAEAVGRMIELSNPNDAPKNAFTLLRVLSDSYGQAYLETALDTSSSFLQVWEGKFEPPLNSIRVLRNIDMTVQLWQRYVSTALMPLAGSSIATRREMSAYNGQGVSRIEGKVNDLLHRFTDAVTSWLSSLLQRQKRQDFKPRSDANLFESERTEPCSACCNFISRLRDIVQASVTGKNQEGLLTDIGITFHSLLLEHFKRYPVGETGTILLTKDLAAYQDTMTTFNIPVVTERFEMLRQLGKLFEVQVDALNSFLEAEHLARIDRRLLRPYIMLRADYDRYPKKTFDAIFGESLMEKTALNKLADSVNVLAIR